MKIQFNPLKDHEVYVVIREDGETIGVTKHPEKMLEQIISDEFCQGRVTVDQVVYNKHACEYEVAASIYEDENDEEGNEHEFTVTSTVFYQPKIEKKLVHDELGWCDVHKNDVSDSINKELEGYHTYEDTNTLNEHLFSIDLLDSDLTEGSEELQEFINQLRKEAPNTAYFRLI